MDLKLVPHGDSFEACYRGPNVTPGYWRDRAATESAFDEDGFFRSGDLPASSIRIGRERVCALMAGSAKTSS